MGLFLTNLYVSVGLVRQGRKLIIIPKINDYETPRKSRSSKLVNFYGGFFYVIFTALLVRYYTIAVLWFIFISVVSPSSKLHPEIFSRWKAVLSLLSM